VARSSTSARPSLFKAGRNAGASVSGSNILGLDRRRRLLACARDWEAAVDRARHLPAHHGFAVALVSSPLDDRIYVRADLEVLDILPLLGVISRDAVPGRHRSG
jgi:hypothetical protein